MTRKERIAATITGIALFCVAALFSIGLILGLLDFGSTTGESFLPALGQMLLSVYGLSSILVPAFFFVAGAFCLSAKWSIQRAFILLVSIIPFFTLVISEQICVSISNQDTSPLAFVKIFSILIIAILLVILEYLLAVNLASYIENRILEKGRAKDEKPVKKIEEIEWGPEYSKTPAIDPSEQEIPDLDEDFAEESKKESFSILKSRPANFKNLFVNKISFAKKAKATPEISEPDVTVDETESVESEDNPIIETFEQKKKSTFNWSIDDEGNIKNAPKTPEPSVFQEENNDPEIEKEYVDLIPDDEITIDDEIDVEPADGETVHDDAKDDFTTVDVDSFSEDKTVAVEEEKDTISFEDDSEYGSSKEISFDDNDVIDQFEMESESLTAEMDSLAENPDNSTEIEYDIEFEDPQEETEEEFNDFLDDDQSYDPDSEIEANNVEDNFEDSLLEEQIASDIENSFDEMDSSVESSEQDNMDTMQSFQNEDKTANFNPDATALNDIFSQMEKDARAQVEGEGTENVDPLAPAVVDSQGNRINGNAVTSFADGTTKPAVEIPPKKKKKLGAYKISTDLLTAYAENEYWIIDEETKQASLNLQETLKEFSIQAEITGIRKGPVVTMFEILPAPGVKLSKIVGLADNIALRLAAKAVRIVAPIPGKRAVGIEIPNRERAIVSFRECIEQNRPEWKKMGVPVILGKDIQGETQIMDLVKTPHLLIAGSTGAGKSVCVNTMILSILYKRSPNDVKMILIDPKVVELKLYNNIPHLLTPVITESKKAMQALQYCLCEMERRYAVLDSMGCRDISSYNKKIIDQHIATEKLPYLIVIIDEFADLMATTGKQLEGVVARLCAMSRAVGIHLVLATQRPSVDVITGLIKANIPSRVAFMVAAKTDSRIIIDQVGAEKLLGKGDMLYASATDPFPVRIQGTLVTDQEVEDVVEAVKEWGEPEYIDDEIFVDDEEDESNGQMSLFNDGADDPLYDKALDIVVQAGKASASYIQRRLSIGYNRAARLVELMEERGIVGPANGSKPREIIHIP